MDITNSIMILIMILRKKSLSDISLHKFQHKYIRKSAYPETPYFSTLRLLLSSIKGLSFGSKYYTKAPRRGAVVEWLEQLGYGAESRRIV